MIPEFVSEYVTWFLVGGIIGLMALVGYFAEKTNFGRGGYNDKPRRKKPEKQTELAEVEEVGQIVTDDEIANEATSQLDKTEQIDVDKIADVKEKEAVSDEDDVWKF